MEIKPPRGLMPKLSYWVGVGVVFALWLTCLSAKAYPNQFSQNVAFPFTEQQTISVGAQLDAFVRQRTPASSVEALQDYVSEVGKKIAAQSPQQYPFTYTVLANTHTAEAFSGPGGFIYITTGLLNMLENESQLAAVLVHETAHVIDHDAIHQMMVEDATDLNVVLFKNGGDTTLSSALTHLGDLLLGQQFNADEEQEANLLGVQMMASAGYNPKGMVQVLDKFNALASQGVNIAFLQSHPASQASVKILQEYIQRNHLEQPAQVLDSQRFHEVIY